MQPSIPQSLMLYFCVFSFKTSADICGLNSIPNCGGASRRFLYTSTQQILDNNQQKAPTYKAVLICYHALNDVILCLLLQLPECIVYYLPNNFIKRMVYWQSTLHFNDFLIEF